MSMLYEDYRPKTFDDVIGQPEALKRLAIIRNRGGFGGKVFYLTGNSGTGKTTLARLIASEIADPLNIIEIDAQDVTMEFIRDMEQTCKARPLFGQFHVFIINESHKLRDAIVSRFLTLFEANDVCRYATFIFTTTSDGAKLFDENFDSCPFGSRCLTIPLARRNLAEVFAAHAKQIAEKEQLDGMPMEKYVRLAKDCGNNLRLMLSKIESGAMME